VSLAGVALQLAVIAASKPSLNIQVNRLGAMLFSCRCRYRVDAERPGAVLAARRKLPRGQMRL
jgi:hypothetical protein